MGDAGTMPVAMEITARSQQALDRLCQDHGLLAVYLFGSRSDDGLALLEGHEVSGEGSDLDVGVVFRGREHPDFRGLGLLQVQLEDLFAPLRVDLVPLQRVDALFQFDAMDAGHRIVASDHAEAAYYELYVMRRAAELLPIQRRLELEEFGVTTA